MEYHGFIPSLPSGHTALTNSLSVSDFLSNNYGFIVKCRKCPHCSKSDSETDLPSNLNGFPSHLFPTSDTLKMNCM